MKFDKDLLRQKMTVDDVKKVMNSLGAKEPIENLAKGEIYFQTICHNKHGGKHKLYYYIESNQFHCYTDCSCNYDIYDLIVKAKEYSFSDAVHWLAEELGMTFGFGSYLGTKQDEIEDWKWLRHIKKRNIQPPELEIYPPHLLDVFCPYHHQSWLDEGISHEAMNKFQIKWYDRHERITIPHRDVKGNLIGLRGRATREWEIEAGKKYMPLTIEGKLYRHSTGANLYGLYENAEAIRRLKKIILFEGEKSVLKTDTFYGKDNVSTAVCGSQLSIFQIQQIINSGAEEAVIAFDRQYIERGTKEYKDWAQKVRKTALRLTPYVRVSVLFDDWDILQPKDSPVDEGQDMFEKLMKLKYDLSTNEDKE